MNQSYLKVSKTSSDRSPSVASRKSLIWSKLNLSVCAQQIQKNIGEITNIQLDLLMKIVYELGLQPNDLKEKTKKEIKKQSLQQLKSLSKEDIQFYLNNKYIKIEKRRKKILKEIYDKYKQIEQNKAQNFLSIQSQHQFRKQSRYSQYEIQLQKNRFQFEYRRIKVLEKLKERDIKQNEMRESKRNQYFNRLSIATQKRNAYQAHLQSIRYSPDKLIAENQKRRLQKIEINIKQGELSKQKLIKKLQKAYQQRKSKRSKIQRFYIKKNQQKQQRYKQFKHKKSTQVLQNSNLIRSELEQDLENHELNKKKKYEMNLQRIKSRQMQINSKIQKIKIIKQKQFEQDYKKKSKYLTQKNESSELYINQIKKKMSQISLKNKLNKIDQINKIYRKRTENDQEYQQKMQKLEQQREENYQKVIQRRISLEKQKKRLHILENINMQIAQMNHKRKEIIQYRQIKKTEQSIRYQDSRYQDFVNRKKQIVRNREKLKNLIFRKKQSINQYYNCQTKDFTTLQSSNNFPTEKAIKNVHNKLLKSMDYYNRAKFSNSVNVIMNQNI